MSTFIKKSFRTASGVDAYNPDIVAEELAFFYLDNIEPRLGRLVASRGYALFQNLAATLAAQDVLIGFAFYQLSTRDYVNLYVFSKTSVYWFDFSTSLFYTTAIYTGFPSSLDPYVFLPWYDALYVTKLLAPYVKLERKTATVISGVPSARYGLVANSHAFLGGVNDGVTSQLARTQWSDLDAPESFGIDVEASEADFFDLEPDSREITGLSYQRGSVVVYAQNTIWLASYVGFPGGFRHDPIFPGVGNVFHDAVVRAKDVDFFIGPDNFYALNGSQLVPIGDPIYERFINDVYMSPVAGVAPLSVRGYHDPRKRQVFWVYSSRSQSFAMWSVVYNYGENKWSERDPQDIRGWFDAPRVAMRGYDAIDDVSTIINSASGLIDDPTAGYPVVLKQLAGCGQKVGAQETYALTTSSATIVKLDGSSFAYKMETVDFLGEDFAEFKEYHQANILLTRFGTPTIYVEVGIRTDQSSSFSWSDPIELTTLDGSTLFPFRAQGVARYLRFRFTWTAANNSYVNDIRVLSITKVNTPDANTSK